MFGGHPVDTNKLLSFNFCRVLDIHFECDKFLSIDRKHIFFLPDFCRLCDAFLSIIYDGEGLSRHGRWFILFVCMVPDAVVYCSMYDTCMYVVCVMECRQIGLNILMISCAFCNHLFYWLPLNSCIMCVCGGENGKNWNHSQNQSIN